MRYQTHDILITFNEYVRALQYYVLLIMLFYVLSVGSFMYETSEVTYDISNVSPKDLLVNVQVQLLEGTDEVEYIYTLDECKSHKALLPYTKCP